MPDPVPATVSVDELREWVRAHRVTWESSLRREATPGQQEPAEFELTLLGRCPGGHVPVDDDVYALVFERLRAVALHALEPAPDARYSIDPFDAAVHMRADESWAPEVELNLVIEGAGGDPSDPGQLRRVEARIEAGLGELGVQRGHWRGP